MCDAYCKEFKGWCRAFTRVERALLLLEAALLVLLVALLVFLTLHLIVCSTPTTNNVFLMGPSIRPSIPSYVHPNEHSKHTHNTLDPKIKCTWEPSIITKATAHYYDTKTVFNQMSTKQTTPPYSDSEKEIIPKEYIQSDVSDGEEVNDERKTFVIALVKMKPPSDITFGCILTVISEYWVLTAASCIEAIEELDSLDSFVMMEGYGTEQNGRIHSISDLQVHPFYSETDKSYDIAALRSEDSLLRGDKRPIEFVSAIDDALVAIGERFYLLGYGAFRSIETGQSGRRLRTAYVYGVAGRLCARAGDEAALRHLLAGRKDAAGSPPATRRLCAAVLAARGLPCNYCAGAPLLLPGRGLLALMSDAPQCGVACEPQVYLPLALVTDWIERVIS